MQYLYRNVEQKNTLTGQTSFSPIHSHGRNKDTLGEEALQEIHQELNVTLIMTVGSGA